MSEERDFELALQEDEDHGGLRDYQEERRARRDHAAALRAAKDAVVETSLALYELFQQAEGLPDFLGITDWSREYVKRREAWRSACTALRALLRESDERNVSDNSSPTDKTSDS